jgi:hypothetical protein
LEGKDGRRTSYRRWLSFSSWTDGTVRQAREMSVGVVGGIRIVSYGVLSRERYKSHPELPASMRKSRPRSLRSREEAFPPHQGASSLRGRFKSRDGTRGPFTPIYRLAVQSDIWMCTYESRLPSPRPGPRLREVEPTSPIPPSTALDDRGACAGTYMREVRAPPVPAHLLCTEEDGRMRGERAEGGRGQDGGGGLGAS